MAVLGEQIGRLVRLEHQPQLGGELPFGDLLHVLAGVGGILVRGHLVVVVTGARRQHPALAKLDLVEGPERAALAGGGGEAQLAVTDEVTWGGRPLEAGTLVVGVLILDTPGQTLVDERLAELHLSPQALLLEAVVIQGVLGHIGIARVDRILGGGVLIQGLLGAGVVNLAVHPIRPGSVQGKAVIQHQGEVVGVFIGDRLVEDGARLGQIDGIRILPLGEVVHRQLQELIIGEVPLALEQHRLADDVELVLVAVMVLGHPAVAPGVTQQVLELAAAQRPRDAGHLLVAAGGIARGRVQVALLPLEEVAGILGGDGDDAPQGIGAVGRGRRPLGHFHLLDHVGVEVGLAHTAVLVGVVLAHPVLHHLDPVLAHAANGEGLGIPRPPLHAHARLITEQIGDIADDLLLDLLRGDDGDGAGDVFQLLLHAGAADDHDFIRFLVCGESRGYQPGRHGEGNQRGGVVVRHCKVLIENHYQPNGILPSPRQRSIIK